MKLCILFSLVVIAGCSSSSTDPNDSGSRDSESDSQAKLPLCKEYSYTCFTPDTSRGQDTCVEVSHLDVEKFCNPKYGWLETQSSCDTLGYTKPANADPLFGPDYCYETSKDVSGNDCCVHYIYSK